jgi:hypothetical protein
MAVFDKRGLSTSLMAQLPTHDNWSFRELRFSKPEVSLGVGLAVV